jgi:hypothetical protein
MRRFSKKQWAILALVLFLLLTSIGLRIFRRHIGVDRVRNMSAELFSDAARNLPATERREKMDALRKAREQLTPAEREELATDARKRREAELERYAKLSKEEKLQFLDERIDRMQAMQAAGQGRAGGNGRGPGNAPTSQNADDRERQRKQMLDFTTPEQRALRDNFIKDMRARLAQRGIPGAPGGPR